MESPKLKVLVVDDEQENLKALERTLRSRFEVTPLSTPAEALQRLEAEDFSVIISDQRMPGMLGTDLLAQAAKRRPKTTRVILTAYTETKEILDAINRAEIYRYITKPWDNNELLSTIVQAAEHHSLLTENEKLVGELKALNQNLEKMVEKRTAELREANAQLSELAMTDPLTKLLNRRAFFAKFHEEMERSRRYKHPLVVGMIDVDHFKTFNDMEGHLFGDEALRKVAGVFSGNLRKTDAMGRYGGEEFVLLMPETRIANALEICERLRGQIEATQFQGHKEVAYLTVSIGLAGFPGDGETVEEMIQTADQALYAAKQGGRNRVIHQRKNASFFS